MNAVCERLERDITAFRALLEDYIQPMTWQAVLSGPFTDAVRPLSPVVYDTQYQLKLFVSEDCRIYFIFRRRLPFSISEKGLIEEIIVRLREKGGRDMVPDSLSVQEVIDRVVARHIHRDHADVVFRLIQMYRRWRAEMTERPFVRHVTGIYFNRQKNTGCNIFSMLDENQLRSLGASGRTLLSIDRNGFVQSVEMMGSPPVLPGRSQDVLAPVATADVALWTDSRNRAAVMLGEKGDILLFSRKQLVFVMTGEGWRYFPHDVLLESMFSDEVTESGKKTREAAYLTSLDLAFEGLMGSIAIFSNPAAKKKRLEKIYPRFRFSPVLLSERACLLDAAVGTKRFYEISRNIRTELWHLEGMLVLGKDGELYAGQASTAFALPAGEKEDPDTPAASEGRDIGIKISGTGHMEIYRGRDIPLAFA